MILISRLGTCDINGVVHIASEKASFLVGDGRYVLQTHSFPAGGTFIPVDRAISILRGAMTLWQQTL